MRHTRICPICSVEFKTYGDKQMCCSRVCNIKNGTHAKMSHMLPRHEVKCQMCGKSYIVVEGYERKFCSIQCCNALRKGVAKRCTSGESPNKFEKKVHALLKKDFPYRVRFVGDMKHFINGRSPDFINKQHKIVVLANGIYWHYDRFNFEFDPEINRHSVEVRDAFPFLSSGYRVYIVWEDDMRIKEITLSNSLDSMIGVAGALNFAYRNKVNRSHHNRQLVDKLVQLQELTK